MEIDEPKEYINYFKEAFRLPINLIFLSTVTLVSTILFILDFRLDSLGLGPEIVVLGAATLEMLYLAIVPFMPHFIKAVNTHNRLEIQQMEAEIQSIQTLQKLTPENIQKYILFKQKRANTLRIMLDYKGNSTLIQETVQEKLIQLESAYVEALRSMQGYQQLLNQTSEKQLNEELQKLKTEQSTASDKIKDVLERRKVLIDKRLEKYKQIIENDKVIAIQIQTLEDTLNYLMENALNPAQIETFSDMVDQVVNETETYQESLKEVEGIFSQSENL